MAPILQMRIFGKFFENEIIANSQDSSNETMYKIIISEEASQQRGFFFLYTIFLKLNAPKNFSQCKSN